MYNIFTYIYILQNIYKYIYILNFHLLKFFCSKIFKFNSKFIFLWLYLLINIQHLLMFINSLIFIFYFILNYKLHNKKYSNYIYQVPSFKFTLTTNIAQQILIIYLKTSFLQTCEIICQFICNNSITIPTISKKHFLQNPL